jgi:hypothetical protein
MYVSTNKHLVSFPNFLAFFAMEKVKRRLLIWNVSAGNVTPSRGQPRVEPALCKVAYYTYHSLQQRTLLRDDIILAARRPQRTWNNEKAEQSVNNFHHTGSWAHCTLQLPTRHSHTIDIVTGNNSLLFNMMIMTITMSQWQTALKHRVQYSLIWQMRSDTHTLLRHTQDLCSSVQYQNIVTYRKLTSILV